ncbi:uncharacterized protein LOC105801234 [Gossypium raimondii]|uniref:uncharacterized protein LOC105801234 n=1 Tax=Gossypium raimondii TaxID=29730 RepID=UPI00063A987F|nr:uncharacterized protein LOC105801234 [Gossypium raimondii]
MTYLDAVRNFPRPPQRRYDPYANTYIPGWKDHHNLSYGANSWYNQPYQNLIPQQPRDLCTSLETMINKLAANMLDFQQKTESIRELTTSIEKMNSQGKLLSQTEPNPRQHANALTLRSGKVLKPNPGRLNQHRRGKEEKEILEAFRNVEINISLLDAIKQISRYAKFLKELCTNKRKLIGNKRVSVGASAVRVVNISLADMSIVHPEVVFEDILVKVNRLIFPADFYVIKMEEDNALGSSDILLGRPFLNIANTKIDVRSRTLTMEYDGEIDLFVNVNELLAPMDTKLLPSVV